MSEETWAPSGQPAASPWMVAPPPPTPPPAQRQRRARLPVATVALLMAAATGLGTVIGHGLWSSRTGFTALQSTPSSSGSSSGGTPNVASVAAAVDPALVDINVSFPYQGAKGAGTGIVLTSKGVILTNNHVIEGASDIQVTDIGNGRTYTATVVGYDQSADVAVLQLSGASGLQTAKLGNSSNLTNGQSVVALGNAGGAGGTPSSAGGTITGLNQAITASDDLNGTQEQLTGLIQTNANIQPGDSGGALANTAGRIIGINTAGSTSGSFGLTAATQGYAIPINQAISIANQIEAGHGTSTIHVGPTAFLGVLISTSNQDSSGNGATISSVVSGGPAAAAGLSAGDVITSVDGQTIGSAATMSSLLQQDHPGQTIQVGWTDSSGQSNTTAVQLGSGPAA
jgi:S1-C subfamily serine protease